MIRNFAEIDIFYIVFVFIQQKFHNPLQSYPNIDNVMTLP